MIELGRGVAVELVSCGPLPSLADDLAVFQGRLIESMGR